MSRGISKMGVLQIGVRKRNYSATAIKILENDRWTSSFLVKLLSKEFIQSVTYITFLSCTESFKEFWSKERAVIS